MRRLSYGAALDGLVGRIGRDEVAVLVEHRRPLAVRHLVPDVGVVRDALDIGRLHIRVDDLDARLVLPLLDAVKLRIGQHAVDHADLIVAVVAQRIGGAGPLLPAVHDVGGDRVHHVDHRVVARLRRDAAPEVARQLVLAGAGDAAVEDAPAALGNGTDIGRGAQVELVLVVHGVGRDDRRDDGEQQQHRDDDGRHERALVLFEAQKCVRQVAARLRFELLVVNGGVPLHELEFFRRDMPVLLLSVHAHFFDPILMRGSMNP